MNQDQLATDVAAVLKSQRNYALDAAADASLDLLRLKRESAGLKLRVEELEKESADLRQANASLADDVRKLRDRIVEISIAGDDSL